MKQAKQITGTMIITRRSILGWNYGTAVRNTDKGWEIIPPSGPHYKGTYKQVCEMIDECRDYAACKSGGAYFISRWYAKRGGKWVEIYHPMMYIVAATELGYAPEAEVIWKEIGG